MPHRLSHVRTWFFDLDNTLYPPAARLFDQIQIRMTDWMARELDLPAAEADALRDRYWARYGTTLAGLMAERGIAPGPFLAYTHDIDFGVLAPDPGLAAAVAALPGRKVIFTNGHEDYARSVLVARGLTGVFDAIYGAETAGYHPKPQAAAYDRVFAAEICDLAAAAMFEDDPRNLSIPHARGMGTVLVGPEEHAGDHIQHRTDDLAGFLSQLG